MSAGNNIVTYVLLFVTIGLCLGSWRDCNKTDLPCIQFGRRLCICTPFWDTNRMRRVFLYICENAPFNTPKWVRETWACPVPGIGNPGETVWSTYLETSLKGLVKLPIR